MPKRIPPLSDNQIRNTKEHDYKLNDGLGLYVLIARTGVRFPVVNWQNR